MIDSIRRNARAAALVGAAAALVSGGMAIAADGGGGGSAADAKSARAPSPPLPPLPPLPRPAGAGGDLTFAEFHVRRDGVSKVFRTDAGKVESVGTDSVTIAENDGSKVEIPVDSDTKVFAGPGKETGIGGLEQGREVNVSREKGKPADLIFVVPTRAELKAMDRGVITGGARLRRAPHGAPPHGAPPPGFAIPLPPARGN
jgi:hypothetical protein